MKVILVALALFCTVALVSAQATPIDDFVINQDGLRVDATTPSRQTSVANNAIYGGQRDTTIDLDPATAGTCNNEATASNSVRPTDFLNIGNGGKDTGIFLLSNDQSCSAKNIITYAGVGSTGLAGAARNFNSVGSAFHLRFTSDLAGRDLIVRVVSGANTCQVTLRTEGNNIVDDETILFTSFLPASCDFNAIDRLQIEVPAQSNLDIGLALFEIISTSLSGRVYVDCACDNTFGGNDQPISGVSVTATPGAGCPAGSTSKSTTTLADGTYRINGLSACTYNVAPTVSNFSPCGTSSTRTGTTILGQETTNINFPYRGTSNFIVPPNTEVFCNESTDPANTGTATTSSICDAGRVVQPPQDTTTRGNCDAKATISRRWTDGVNSGTQVITVKDTAVGPSIVCPNPITVPCDSSLLPSTTGRPTVDDDCSDDIDVNYTGTDADAQCDGTSCTRNKIVTRVFRATDDCGNVGPNTCTQIITITPCASAKTCPNPANCHNGLIRYINNVAQP